MEKVVGAGGHMRGEGRRERLSNNTDKRTGRQVLMNDWHSKHYITMIEARETTSASFQECKNVFICQIFEWKRNEKRLVPPDRKASQRDKISGIYGARMKAGRQTDRRRFAFGGKGIRDKWTLVRTVTVSKPIRLSNTRGNNHAWDLITHEWEICAQRSQPNPHPLSLKSPDGQEETERSRRPIPSLLLSSSRFCVVGAKPQKPIQGSHTHPHPHTHTLSSRYIQMESNSRIEE